MVAVPVAFVGALFAIPHVGEGPYWNWAISLWVVAGVLVVLAVFPYGRLKRPGD